MYTKISTLPSEPNTLNIQNDLLNALRTTVVIPLSPETIAAPMRLSRLNPSLIIGNETFIAITQDLAGIDRNQLGPQIYDLSVYRTEVVAGLDFLISGI